MKWSRANIVFSLTLLTLSLTPAEAQIAAYSAAASTVAEKIARAFPKVQGVIVSITEDGKVILDVSAKDGLYPGLEMEAFREGETFKHPVTGEVLGKMDKILGSLKVVEVRERFSVAQPLDPGGSLQKGDGVRMTGARILLGLGKVESAIVGEAEARAITRELQNALNKTDRFEVIDDRMMRSTLTKARLKEETPLTDPAALQVLRQELRLSALALPRLSDLQGGRVLDLQLLSARTAHPLTVVSAEVPVGVAEAPPAASAPAKQGSRPPQPGPVATGPAWLGPPASEGSRSKLNPNFVENPFFRGFDSTRDARTYFIQPLPAGIRFVDFGDVDGDGKEEMVAVTDRDILIFQWNGSFYVQATKITGQKTDNYLWLDVADVNGNGVAEIFVTNMVTRLLSRFIDNRLNSFVLEFKDGKYLPIWKEVPLYFRVLKTPKYPEGLLLAMDADTYVPFKNPIMRYRWIGKAYARDGGFRLPEGIGLYGFTLVDFKRDGTDRIVILGFDGVVRIFDRDGKKIAESKEGFGSYDHVFFYQMPKETPQHVRDDWKTQDVMEKRLIQRRVVVTDLGPEGAPGLLVGRNFVDQSGVPVVGGLLSSAAGSRVTHLAWDGITIKQQWETELSRRTYVADYGIAHPNGPTDKALVVFSLEPQFLRDAEGTLEVFRLVMPTAEAEVKAGEIKPAPVPK